ncbi:MAG: DUF1501 domain-containing protein [Thermoguttaceae bacterium]|nr:DUF1501 domain-containing protein [Thermoguttaceae bacterium]MDW8078383.1 DUF1501 domain-containing protein [Thermoguttaceae bacterium]
MVSPGGIGEVVLHVGQSEAPQSANGSLERRAFLRRGVFGLLGLSLAGRYGLGIAKAANEKTTGRAKAVIQIWMWGGPSHLDTFDPKPNAGYEYCGAFAGVSKTNVDGIVIGELLTELAKHADKYSLIRSMTHGVNAHETAAYLVQTGRMPGDRIVYPHFGAVITFFGTRDTNVVNAGLIPPYVVLTDPQGRFSEAGFLGPRYKPFATGGDPARTPFAVEGIITPGTTETQQRRRRELLVAFDTLRKQLPNDPQIQELVRAEEQAYDLILGETGKAFDPAQEPQEVRDTYGRNTFGQSCLVARRLIERGVRFITINYKGWDTHKDHFTIMRRKLPEFDRALAALINDLAQRGLLESTIVLAFGEFGRTPKVAWEAPWNGGRHHWGHVFSALVAGGGFKGGCVVGESDDKGMYVKSRPVYPTDLIGSVYQLMGIEPTASLRHPQGFDVPLLPSKEEMNAQSGGLLTEIMA